MSIDAINQSSACQVSSATQLQDPGSTTLEPPSCIGFGSVSAFDIVEQLASLMLKNVAAARDNARTLRNLDREQQYRMEAVQVQQLHDKGDSIFSGAVASGLCSIGSGALAVAHATRGAPAEPNAVDPVRGATTLDEVNGPCSKWGAVPGALTEPLGRSADSAGKLFGDAPAAHHEASAKAAELAAQRAKDGATDHNDRLQELSSVAQEALQAIKTAQATHNELVQTILRRM